MFIILSNAFGVLAPIVIRHAIDLVNDNLSFYFLIDGSSLTGQYQSHISLVLLIFGLTILALSLLRGLFTFFMRQTIIVVSRHIEYDLKNEIYAHYQKLSLAFYKRNQTGDLMNRATEDVSKVRMYVGPGLMYAINLIVLFIMVIATMIQVNAELTFYVLLPLPFLSVSIYVVNSIIQKRQTEIQQQLSSLTSIAQESYSGIRVIKSFVQEKQLLKYFEKESELMKQKAMKLVKTEAYFFPLMLLLIGLSTIITIYVGGRGVISGKISPGNIAEFVIYINMLTWPVTAIGWVASIVQTAEVSQKRINEFLHIQPEIKDEGQLIKEIEGSVEFRNVDFTYPVTGIHALRDVSFTVNPGQRIAIIGRTGSGKSTIADMLLRTYEPDKGKVLIDKNEIESYSLGFLRNQIGYVPQDIFLFSDSIANNISFGSDLPESKSILEAAANASIDKDIERLPLGYQTIIGERGVTLSGGQKQRISIARALIKNPELLILDDCLSAVDAKTEEQILLNLDRVLEGRTSIIITHRIFSLLNFDFILVIDDGRIVEQGTHHQLLVANGLYASLYEKQNLEEKTLSL